MLTYAASTLPAGMDFVIQAYLRQKNPNSKWSKVRIRVALEREISAAPALGEIELDIAGVLLVGATRMVWWQITIWGMADESRSSPISYSGTVVAYDLGAENLSQPRYRREVSGDD